MADFNIFGTAPESLAGLLGEQATKDLQRKAMTTGLINTALGYLVQPKNQNLGLGRILGQSLMSGMTGAQGVYSGALEDWQTKQKIAELQRKQEQQSRIQGYIGNIQDPNERMLAELAPNEYVTNKLKPRERKYEKLGNQLVDVSSDTPTVAFTGTPESVESWSDPYQLGGQTVQKNNVTGQIRQAVTLPSTTNVTYGAPVSGLDAQGNPVFFQPSKGGGAPAIIPGVKPPEASNAKPSEFEAKAGLYFKSMKTASNTLNDLEGTSKTYMPSTGEVIFDESKKTGQIAISNIRSSERKKYVQAQKQWIDSINRVRSGANLPELEYNRAVATFFPELNDPIDVIQQKSLARKQEETAMESAAGKALPKVVNKIMPSNEPMPQRSRKDILTQYGVE